MALSRTWTATLRSALFKKQAALVVYLACEAGEIAFVLDAAEQVTVELLEQYQVSGRVRARLHCVDKTVSIEATVEQASVGVESPMHAGERAQRQYLLMALKFMDAYEDLEEVLTAGRRAARRHFEWCLVATPRILECDGLGPHDDSEFEPPDERGIRWRRRLTDA